VCVAYAVVSVPGEEPVLGEAIGEAQEDMRLVDPTIFTGLPAANRVSYLSRR
jgi:hypothetical protein